MKKNLLKLRKKNLNSLKSVELAIEHEVLRQIQILEKGGIIENETRSFDVESRVTVPMRDKEVKQDYRCIYIFTAQLSNQGGIQLIVNYDT